MSSTSLSYPGRETMESDKSPDPVDSEGTLDPVGSLDAGSGALQEDRKESATTKAKPEKAAFSVLLAIMIDYPTFAFGHFSISIFHTASRSPGFAYTFVRVMNPLMEIDPSESLRQSDFTDE